MDYLDGDFSKLPDDWKIHPLREVAEIHNTRRAPLNARERETKKGIYPYCGANGVVDSIDEYRFDGEFVLIAEDGGYWGKHEPSSYLMRGKFWVNNHAHVIRERDGVSNNLFLSCQLNFMDISPLIGGDARGKLTKSILERLPLVIPPLGEQRKIAWVLGLVQQAMEQQERLLALTAELKKALLHKLFTEGLRGEPQKQTEIGPVPESWTPTPLGRCCDIVSGSLSYTDFLKMEPSSEEDSVECMGVKVSDMNLPGNESQFVRANLEKRLPVAIAEHKLIPPNTVVFPKRGAAIATNKKRLTTTWTVLDPNLIGLRSKESLVVEFLFHWVQTFDLRKITDPGPTPQLNKKDLAPILMPLPSKIDEQREIATAITCVDSKLICHQRKHATLTSLFRTLLHQLMTAQIRVHDLDLSDLETALKE